MPAKSRSQQRLFCMALAVRKGDLKRSEVNQSVLDIVDGDMTNKQIEDFTKMESTQPRSLYSYITEGYEYTTRYAAGKVKYDFINGHEKYLFVVVKPGFLKYSQGIIEKYQRAGFTLVKTCPKHLTLNEAKRMYYVHHNEDFYNNLCKYMASDTSEGLLFTYTMPTKEAFNVSDGIKDEVRKKYSESEMRNVMHSSDNEKNMEKECSVYFNNI